MIGRDIDRLSEMTVQAQGILLSLRHNACFKEAHMALSAREAISYADKLSEWLDDALFCARDEARPPGRPKGEE